MGQFIKSTQYIIVHNIRSDTVRREWVPSCTKMKIIVYNHKPIKKIILYSDNLRTSVKLAHPQKITFSKL